MDNPYIGRESDTLVVWSSKKDLEVTEEGPRTFQDDLTYFLPNNYKYNKNS